MSDLTGEDALNNAVKQLIGDFDEEKVESAYQIKLMSPTMLAYKEQQERWSKGERRGVGNEPEEPIEFGTYEDTVVEQLYTIPDDEDMVKQINSLVEKYVPKWSKRIFAKHVTRTGISWLQVQ